MFHNFRAHLVVAIALAPLAAHAQLQSFGDVLNLFTRILQMALAILMSLLAFASIYLAYNYIKESRAGKDVKGVRERMIWTIIGTAVIFAFWGLVSLVSGTVDLVPGIPHFSV